MTRRLRLVLLTVFLAGLFGGCASTMYVPTPPPPPRVEKRTARPGPGKMWVEGHWKYNGHKYVWVSGGWRKQGAWVAGHWVKKPRGWVWVPGHYK